LKTLTLGHYLMFGLYMIQIYSGFGLYMILVLKS
jgi:hypothetical protein